MPTEQDKIIHAQPTKDLFISMLIKDIPLTRAIIDLVDNSVDGARRLRGPNGDFDGLTVRIEAKSEHFKISDNCGGITPDTARQYAFRFGRPSGSKPTKHSVGQFGVGMKRALFKLGSIFSMESWTRSSHFVVDIDVDKWKNDTDKWEFEFSALKDGAHYPETKIGTAIKVSALHRIVSDDFKLDNFITRLGNEIREAHQMNIDRKLSVTLNGLPLHVDIASLFHSQNIKPAFEEIKYRQDPITGQPSTAKGDEVTVKVYTGIAKSNPKMAGWYIFCNGRLILGPDQSLVTGWGEGRNNPKYHNQYAMFRGYAFFDADNASLLPWNTTKTGVDSDSASFKSVRQRMLHLAQPVLSFLNDLDREKDSAERPLSQAVEATVPIRLAEVKRCAMFVAPKKARTEPDSSRISYSMPIEKVERARKKLKVGSNRDLGIKTFDYFYERVCRDDGD